METLAKLLLFWMIVGGWTHYWVNFCERSRVPLVPGLVLWFVAPLVWPYTVFIFWIRAKKRTHGSD